MTDIMTPALGESVTEATVAHWSKKAGDAVKRDDVLVELETDKVSLEVVALADGVLTAIDAEEGVTVVPGQRLGQLRQGSGAPAVPPVEAKAETPQVPLSKPAAVAPPCRGQGPGARREAGAAASRLAIVALGSEDCDRVQSRHLPRSSVAARTGGSPRATRSRPSRPARRRRPSAPPALAREIHEPRGPGCG